MPDADLSAQVDALRQRLDVLECATTEDSVLHNGTPSGVDFLPAMNGQPGYVVNAGVARETPCIEYHLSEQRRLTFSQGVVGPLDDEQRDMYCGEVETRQLTPAQLERMRAFDDSAQSCRTELEDVPEGERLAPWVSCMDRELRERQQRL